MPWASFSMLDGPGGTGCVVPVRGCWVSRNVIVAAVYDCVKECMGLLNVKTKFKVTVSSLSNRQQ